MHLFNVFSHLLAHVVITDCQLRHSLLLLLAVTANANAL